MAVARSDRLWFAPGYLRLLAMVVAGLACHVVASAQLRITLAPSPPQQLYTDAQQSGLGWLQDAWRSAVADNGTPTDLSQFDTTVTVTLTRVVADDTMVAITSPSAPYFGEVSALATQMPSIKWDFEGGMLLASVDAQGVVVPIGGGLYDLGIYPGSGLFVIYDGQNQILATAPNLAALASYLTPNDALTLPLSSGAISPSTGELANYSAQRLSQVCQSGTDSGAALTLAEDAAFPPSSPVRYYVHQFGNFKITVGVTTNTYPFDMWVPTPAPAGAVKVSTSQFSRKNQTTVMGITVTIEMAGTMEVWKK